MNTVVNALLVIMAPTATLVSILSGIRKHIAKKICGIKRLKRIRMWSRWNVPWASTSGK